MAKSRNRELLESYGYEFDNDGDILLDLRTADGTSFGKVTSKAYKAAESGTLGSYKPKESEKKAVEAFKSYSDSKMSDLIMNDGSTLGKITADGLEAIDKKTLNTYVPKNDAEKNTIEKYKQVSNYMDSSEMVKGDTLGTGVKYTGEQASWSLKGAWEGIKNTLKDLFAQKMEQTKSDPTMHFAENTGMIKKGYNEEYAKVVDKQVEGIYADIKKSGEELAKQGALIDAKYPDLSDTKRTTGKLIGGTAQLVPMVAASFINPSLGTLVFGSQVYGGSLASAYAEGAELNDARAYAGLEAIKEMAIEKVFGGIPFTKGFADDMIAPIANKVFTNRVTKELAKGFVDVLGEGAEEVAAELISPYLKRATYDKNAPAATAEELAFSFMGGVVPSLIMGGLTGGFTVASYRGLDAKIDKYNESISLLPESVRPQQLSKKTTTVDEYNDAVGKLNTLSRKAQKTAEKEAALAGIDFFKSEISNIENSNVSQDEKSELINSYNAQIGIFSDYVSDIDEQLNDLDLIEKGKATDTVVANYTRPVTDYKALNPTHIDKAAGANSKNGFVNIVKISDDKFAVTNIDGEIVIKTADAVQQRYLSAENDAVAKKLIEQIMSEKAVESAPSPANTNKTVNPTVTVGDVYKDTKYGNTITVTSHDGTNAVVEINTGEKIETKQLTAEQLEKLAESEQYEQIKKGTVSNTENAPTSNVNATEDVDTSEAYKVDSDGKIRFNQIDIDYSDTTMRKGKFKVRDKSAKPRIEEGYIRGKYGIFKSSETGRFATVLLQSGIEIMQFDNLIEAKKGAVYMDDNIAFNDVVFAENEEGKIVVVATEEYKAYVEDIRQMIATKPYSDVKVVEAEDVSTESEKAETEKTETVDTQPNEPKISVGDVYTAEGKTYTITGRDANTTTYTVTDANGKVTTRQTGNVTADVNFTKPDVYTKTHSGAVSMETKKAESGTEVVTEKTEATTDAVENTKPKPKSKATKTDASLKKGEILTLKKTKNIFSVFKGSKKFIEADGLISDSYVVLRPTEENISGMKQVFGREPERNNTVSWDKAYPKDANILLEGVPKTHISNHDVKHYLFKVKDTVYGFQQKYIDAFAHSGNTLWVSKNPKAPLVVKNANGEAIALVYPIVTTGIDYDSLKSVSDIKAEKQAERDAKKNGTNSYMPPTSNARDEIDVQGKGKVKWSSLHPRQQAAITFMEGIAKVANMDLVLTVNLPDNGCYAIGEDTIYLDVFAGVDPLLGFDDTFTPTASHELTHWMSVHASSLWINLSAKVFKALEEVDGISTETRIANEIERLHNKGFKEANRFTAEQEIVARACEDMLKRSKFGRELFDSLSESEKKTFTDKIKEIIKNFKDWISQSLSSYESRSYEANALKKLDAKLDEISKLWDEVFAKAVEVSQNTQRNDAPLSEKVYGEYAVEFDMDSESTAENETFEYNKELGNNLKKTSGLLYNERFVKDHLKQLEEKYSEDATVPLDTLIDRYQKVVDIWKKLGGELNSTFLNAWNNRVGSDRAFAIFKNQVGYKYNVELSTMCKKGIPLFEAIDTIVKKEVMQELNTKTLGKAEKEILYSILKGKGFDIPCAICYVEQARQGEGRVIDAFLNGKIETSKSGKITQFKLGWNETLKKIQGEMQKSGADFRFPTVDRSIATDSYVPADLSMDEQTQEAFFGALKKIANAEIRRYNKDNNKSRKLITKLDAKSISEVFSGTLPLNLRMFKTLFMEPSSRFMIEDDLLYSSMTTLNLASSHNNLYTLFNMQGGTSGYKSKQTPIVYWGDILKKNWTPDKLRSEGAIRYQSNSDSLMYTLLDQVQMYVDLSAKGYYLQVYTKVLPALKLFGLSKSKQNISFIAKIFEYENADGTVDEVKTRENAGLDENGELLFDDIEGVSSKEALMLIEDTEYSKSISGTCVGYSDNHILKLLDDDHFQQIIGFHDKSDEPTKRYKGAVFAKNYNGLNEAVNKKSGKTVHINFNTFIKRAENKFKAKESVTYGGKTYTWNDVPRLAADLYLEHCDKRGLHPAYSQFNTDGVDFSKHRNYYKLLADFGLYDINGNYAPLEKVEFNMPDKVPYLDENGEKAYMPTEKYIKKELGKEIAVRDDLAEKLADRSKDGIIPEFVRRVNKLHNGGLLYSERNENSLLPNDTNNDKIASRNLSESGDENGRNNEEKTGDIGGRVGRVSEELGDKGRRDSGDSGDLSIGVSALDGEKIRESTNNYGEGRKGSGSIGVDVATSSRVSSDASSGKKTNGERFLEAVNSGDEKTARELLDEQARRNGFVPANVYHGTRAEEVFTKFNEGAAIWVSTSKEYAEGYTSENASGVKSYLFTEEDSAVYDLYVKHGKVLDLGDINEVLATPTEMLEFAEKIGFSKKDILKCLSAGRKYKSYEKWTFSVTPEFADIARSLGYDSLRAIERGGVETYGILYPENVKSAKTATYDENNNIIPLDERFNTKKNNILYSERENTNYLELAKNPEQNKAKLREMVSTAAKEAGFPTEVYHGTLDFGFTDADVSKSDDHISFFATDSLDVARTYSGSEGVQEIGKRTNIDDGIEKFESQYEDAVSTFIDTVNRTAGVYNFMPYTGNRFNEFRITIEEGTDSYDNVSSDLNDYVEEIVSDLQYQLDEEIMPEAFYESEEVQEVYKAAEELYKPLKELEKLLDKIVGNYHLYANTDGFFELDAQGKGWNSLSLPQAVNANEYKYKINYRGEGLFNYFKAKADDEFDFELYKNGEEVANGVTSFSDMMKMLRKALGDGRAEMAVRVATDGSNIGSWDYAVAHSDDNGKFVDVRPVNTRQVARYAKEKGYNGVKISNVFDDGGRSKKYQASPASVYIFFKPEEQTKSADLVTYDDDGNIIPLDERFNRENGSLLYSERETAPTFFSLMNNTIDEMKQEKIGAGYVIPHLKNRGVKNEEIKWSGIREFLEGKKSVTKAELQEFVKNNTLQIETKELTSDFTIDYTDDERKSLDELSEVINEKWEEMESLWESKYGEEMPWDIRYHDNNVSALNYELIRRHKKDAGDESFFSQMHSLLDKVMTFESNQNFIVSRAENRTRLEKGNNRTKHDTYSLDGGSNYREFLFKLPGSTYSNDAMSAHWGEEGVLAHARVQDFEVDGKKMLFIEEIQSDWHNEGNKTGYVDNSKKLTVKNTEMRRENGWYNLYHDGVDLHQGVSEEFIAQRFRNGITDAQMHEGLVDEYNRSVSRKNGEDLVPDAPFRDNYHEYVLKSLLRTATEQGYDSIGWTPADVQIKRWSKEFAKGYKIEYDQDIPKFLNKYGKQWGAKVGISTLDANGTKVWSMDITDEMRNDVLYKGQPLYSERDNGVPDLFESLSEAIQPTETSTAPKTTAAKLAPSNDVASMATTPTAKENVWVDDDATTKPKAEEVPSLSELVKDISDSFGLPIKTGKVSIRRAIGIYKKDPEVVRTRTSNDLPTIIHELGHHLSKHYGLENSQFINEADVLVDPDFLKQYKKADVPGELAAEFVRRYFKNPDAVAKACPNLTQDFLNSLDKNDAKSVERIAPKVHTYLSAESGDRYGATIIDSKQAKWLNKEDLVDIAHDLYTKWIDKFHPIKQLIDFVEDATGSVLAGAKNAYKLATNTLNAHSISNYVLLDKFRGLDGKVISGYDTFVDCVKELDLTNVKTRKAFSEYLKLKHALEVQAQSKRVFADDTLGDVKNINARLAKLKQENPKFEDASKKLYDFQYHVLTEYAVKSGLVTQEQADFLHQTYPCYVPFFRHMKGGKGSFTRNALANQKSPVKSMKGSGLDTLDHLESIIANTERIIAASLKHQTADVLSKYADTVEGVGAFIERIPPDQVAKTVAISDLKEKFMDELQHTINNLNDYFAVGDLLDDVFGDTVTGFTPVVNEKKGIIAVQRGDEVAYYQIHNRALLESLTETSPKQMGWTMKFLSKAMTTTNALITQLNPKFSSMNPFRDFNTAYDLGNVDNPAEFIKDYVKAAKLLLFDRNNDMVTKYRSMGGGHSSQLNADLGAIAKSVKDISMKDKGLARRAVYAITHHPMQLLTSLSDFTESIPRFMTFVSTYNKTGDLQEAIYQADDVTTNFKRRGSGGVARVVNSSIRFNNAALQGLDKTARTVADADGKRRVQITTKWLTKAVLMAILLNFFNREVDEEGYENLAAYKKNNFYNFAIGGGEFISIPKERENAVIDTLVERTVDAMFGEDDSFYAFGEYLSSVILPPMLPNTFNPVSALHDVANNTVFGPLADIGFNENFMGTPIESDYEKDLPSNERYSEGSTSKLAYALGQTKFAVDNDLSPKKIDHLISGYFGFAATANKALFPMDESKKDYFMGIVKGFVSDSNYSTDLLNQVYDNRDLAERDYLYYRTADKAVEYEQNAIMADYISEMNKAIKALPKDEQRAGRTQLLKSLNTWKYVDTASQTSMVDGLGDAQVSEDSIFESLPDSKLQWTVNKKKYTYQMTPQEYQKYVDVYVTEMEKARKHYGCNTVEACEQAKAYTKERMSKYKSTVLKNTYIKKATQTSE